MLRYGTIGQNCRRASLCLLLLSFGVAHLTVAGEPVPIRFPKVLYFNDTPSDDLATEVHFPRDSRCRCADCCRKWKLWATGHTQHHGKLDSHHGRVYQYIDGERHGFHFDHGDYAPRAAGATFNFGQWVPRRSYYYPYQPGAPEMPYGFSPEPYYVPEE